MRLRCALLSVGLVFGCDNPQPTLTAVEPAQASSDRDVRLILFGSELIPATILDPLSGRRIATSDGFDARIGWRGQWAKLDNPTWLSTGALAVTLPQSIAKILPLEPLDIELFDPRGQRALLPGKFVELGPDSRAPNISFTSPAPDTLYAGGMILRGSIHASDTAPGTLAKLHWSYKENDEERASGSCYLAAGAVNADCGFQASIGGSLKESDGAWVSAYATDAAGNRADAIYPVSLRDRPTQASVSPSFGGTAGGTDIVILGTGFRAGTQVTIDGELLFPDGGIFIDENTISGHTPAHAPGPFKLVVQTPLGDALGSLWFSYLAPPAISTIWPTTGAASGGTAVTITGAGFSTSTRIYFGQALDSALPLADAYVQSSTSIVGHTPPGSGQTTVWAVDGARGFTKLPSGFTWRTP